MTPPLDPRLFALPPGLVWAMGCAEGPVPVAAQDAVRLAMDRELRPWTVRFQEDVQGALAGLRAEAAAFLGARAADLTLTPTTSSGLVTVAQGFPWREGDEVLLPLGEFPTNGWPYLALASRGVSVRFAPLWEGQRAGRDAWESAPPGARVDPEARLLEAIGPRTRILSVSWVRFQDGLKLDLPRLAEGARARGAALVVDGIQGAGTLPVPLAGVSAFAAGGHKHLLAPSGLGLLWTDEAFRQTLAPPGGWLSVEDAWDFSRPNTDLAREFVADGVRLEAGVGDLVSSAALQVSLRTLNGPGAEKIGAHVRALQAQLLDGLAGIAAWRAEAERLQGLAGAGRLGPMVNLHHGGRGPAGLQALLDAGLAQGIYASVREGYLRIALHGFHTEADVARILGWLHG